MKTFNWFILFVIIKNTVKSTIFLKSHIFIVTVDQHCLTVFLTSAGPPLHETKWSSSSCSATTEQSEKIKCTRELFPLLPLNHFLAGTSAGNHRDLLLCLSCSFAFFRCRAAFNYHIESPFTAIMKERPKASKSPHYTVKHYIQEKQISHYTHMFFWKR